MDPLSITASILTVVGSIKVTYDTIKKIKGLPKAFEVVEKKLSLVVEIVQGAKSSLESHESLNDEDKNAANAVLQPSLQNFIKLKKIFRAVEDECDDDDEDEKDWMKLKHVYHKALKGVKAHKVEQLMEKILKDMDEVAVSHIFQLATTKDIKALKSAIEIAIQDLSNVEPSLPDSDGSERQIHATQNHDNGSTGQQYNNWDGQQTNNTGKYGEAPLGTHSTSVRTLNQTPRIDDVLH